MTKDYNVSIFIITKQNEIIENQEFDFISDCQDAEFVMLTNDRLNSEYRDDNSICIHKNWKSETNNTMMDLSQRYTIDLKHIEDYDYFECQWSINNNLQLHSTSQILIWSNNSEQREMNALDVLDGYIHNKEIISNVQSFLNRLKGYDIQYSKIEEFIPAIMVAFHTKVDFDGIRKNGYLPSIGQLMFIYQNVKSINDVLQHFGEMIPTIYEGERMYGYWWSSTESSSDRAWAYAYAEDYLLKTIYDYDKSDVQLSVLPLYKIDR